MHTPFFPVWRTRLAPMGQRVQHLPQQSLLHLDLLLGSFLPPGLLAQADDGPNSRDRVYNVRRTFFGFLYQVLNPDCPCRQVVRQIQALFALRSGTRVDEGTSAYCQARGRLPWDILPRLRYAVLGLLFLRGVHSLFRLHHARPADLRRGKRLGKNDRLMVWPKPWPWQRPRFLPKTLWKLLPQQLSVRVVRFVLDVPGFRAKS